MDDDSFLARLLAEDGAQGGGKGNAKMEEGVGVVDGVWVGDGDEGEMEFVREREWLLELLGMSPFGTGRRSLRRGIFPRFVWLVFDKIGGTSL